MRGEMCTPWYTIERPCVEVWRRVLGVQHAGRWLHTLLGMGTECVQRRACPCGLCAGLWGASVASGVTWV